MLVFLKLTDAQGQSLAQFRISGLEDRHMLIHTVYSAESFSIRTNLFCVRFRGFHVRT